jgi:hypothetical protein
MDSKAQAIRAAMALQWVVEQRSRSPGAMSCANSGRAGKKLRGIGAAAMPADHHSAHAMHRRKL